MIGTDPGRAFMEKREAMAIMAARPFLKGKETDVNFMHTCKYIMNIVSRDLLHFDVLVASHLFG